MNTCLIGYSRVSICINAATTTTSAISVADANDNNDNSSIIVDEAPRNFKQNITPMRGALLSKPLLIIESIENDQLCHFINQLSTVAHPSSCTLPLTKTFVNSQQHQSNSNKNQKITAFEGNHLAIVCDNPSIAANAGNEDLPVTNDTEVLGMVALEDSIQQLMQEETLDEKVAESSMLLVIADHLNDRHLLFLIFI